MGKVGIEGITLPKISFLCGEATASTISWYLP
jgi:hypothetical protein